VNQGRTKTPETIGATPAGPQSESLGLQGQRLARRLMRSFRATWKLYRGSATGLAGLGIVAGFVFMAAFAPFLTPYSEDFRAPLEDIYIATSQWQNLTANLTWNSPAGLQQPPKYDTLTRILMYSEEGNATIFPINTSNDANKPMRVNAGESRNLPSNISYLTQVTFMVTFFYVLQNRTLYEYTNDLIPTDPFVQYDIPFVPTHISNLWNAYSSVVQNGRMALVFANETSVWSINRRPPVTSIGETTDRIFTSVMNLTDAKVIGNPLVVDADFRNGSMIILPTDHGIMAYKLNFTRSTITHAITNIQIGERMWVSDYAFRNATFEPKVSENMITFPYPHGSSGEDGKQIIVLGTTDGRIVAYDRENGTKMWANRLYLNKTSDMVTNYTIDAVYPSAQVVLITGKTGDKSFIAGVQADTGRDRYNNTQYSVLKGDLNSPPQYVEGMTKYLLSTQQGRVYLVDGLLQLNLTFVVPGGSPRTPAMFLGNIFVSSAVAGNYYGVVAENGTLFLESLAGVDIAPLPPGTYPSGNHYVLGTDYEGHDILTQLMYGTRAELMVGVTAAFFTVFVGTIVGLIAGFYSGLIDDVLMRTTDVVLALPYLVVLLLFAAVFGPSLLNIIIIFAILSWAGIARVIRSVTLSLKERSFVDAAIIAGASESRLIFRHIAPNVLPYTFLYMTFTISGAIITEAILAFLGYGDVNSITWGMMLQFLQLSGHALTAWWWLLPPGIAITLLSLSFYLIGRAFDEVVNPRLRKR